jgi:hypothetical protein
VLVGFVNAGNLLPKQNYAEILMAVFLLLSDYIYNVIFNHATGR